MDSATFVELISRWVHVGTAVVLLGGSVFLRCVVMPAARTLPDVEHDRLREQMMARWKRIVMIGIALLLVTGFYNYLGVERVKAPRYHMLMGIKILLGFGVFFLASALTGRSAGLAGIRRNSARWLTVLIVLAAATVLIAGYLKVAPPPAP